MLDFPEPPKEYAQVFLEDTDKPLPEKLDPNTRYAFFSTIAKGGKSIIQSCKDMHLSRVVCYKSLRPEFADDPIEQRRLLREARVSAMLQHPNTVPTYEVGRNNRGHYYFTMKLVHGYTLKEILKFRERYDLTQLVDVLIQICHALEYAHNHGVAHRDIKPENILVGPYGEVLLLDWGLAKVWSPDGTASDEVAGLDKPIESLTITQQGQLQGTVVYMSPEQVDRDPGITTRTDIYSMGAVLYEVLTGRTPHTGEKVYEVIRSIQEDEPGMPADVTNMRVPKLLQDLAMMCLKKDPEERPDTISDLVRVFQEDWVRDLL